MFSRLKTSILSLLVASMAGLAFAAAEEGIPTEGVPGDVAELDAEVACKSEEDAATLAAIRGACDCCPEWSHYAVFDVLFLQRDNATNGQPIAVGSPVSASPGVPVLTTHSMQFATAPGVRLLYGKRGPDGVGWEVGYLGVYGMFGAANVQDPDMLAVPGDLGSAVTGWSTADIERPTYASSLNIVEANLFLYDCCRGCDPDAILKCKRLSHCHCTDWIGGFFWAGLNEQANLNVTCCPGEPSSAYSANTSSNLFGAQIGLRRRDDWCRWAFERTYKVGLAGASLYQSAGAITAPLSPGDVFRGPESSWMGGVGVLSQLNWTAVYRLNRHWGLRAGYNLIWLSGVALAPNQWDFGFTPTSGTHLVNGGSIFLHGANLGLERRW